MKVMMSIFLILLIVIALLLYKTNSDLRFRIEQQQQEIEASSNYIETLTEELLKNGPLSHEENSDHEDMNNLLEEFLQESDIKPEQLEGSGLDKKFIFIPDHIPVIGEFVVSQKFKDKHQAIDLAAPIGTQVVAAATGEIISIKQDKYFGNMIIMDHYNGFLTVYAHLAKILVKEGDIIKKGSNIGLVGNTGNSTGPHLHFEIIQNGTAVDPEKLIDFSYK